MADRFPGYDVLSKRDTPSWNDKTREVIAERLSLAEREDVLEPHLLAVLRVLIDRIVPQPEGRPPGNACAILLDRIGSGEGDGYRHAQMSPMREAWTTGLSAIDAEARSRHGLGFTELDCAQADTLLAAIERGDVNGELWSDMPPQLFWHWRLLPDIISVYYAHPSAWSAMGFGGPASPRGYVRMDADRRDPWEAAEVDDGALLPARLRNRHAR